MLTRRDEQGFTLVELGVAMSLLLLVTGALLGALESGMNAERHASNRIDDEQSVRLVLAQFAHDVRNAVPLPATPALSPLVVATPRTVQLSDANGDNVVWTYSPDRHMLQRTVLDSLDNPHPGIALGGLTNPDGVFTFLGADGTDLWPDTPSDMDECTTTITLSVTSTAHAPSAPFSESTTAPLAAPGVDRRGCP